MFKCSWKLSIVTIMKPVKDWLMLLVLWKKLLIFFIKAKKVIYNNLFNKHLFKFHYIDKIKFKKITMLIMLQKNNKNENKSIIN